MHNKTKIFLRKWYALFLEIFIVLSCCFLILHSDRFQEKLNPEKYWSIKVGEFEQDFRIGRWKVRSLEISLQKEKANESFEVLKALDYAKSFGKNVEKVLAVEKIKQKHKIQTLQNEINKTKVSMNFSKERLAAAKTKLEKVQH